MATVTANEEQPAGNVVWLALLVALSVLLNCIDRGAIGIAAPLMKTELGLSATMFGLAVSAFFWVYAPINLLVGWLCDRFPVYRMFALGVVVWSLSKRLVGEGLEDRASPQTLLFSRRPLNRPLQQGQQAIRLACAR